MIVANFVTNRATMGDTRTYEDFYKFLGTNNIIDTVFHYTLLIICDLPKNLY